MELHSFSITSHLDVALQVTAAVKMIVFDIRLVFSDLHQQSNVEIQYKTANG